MTDGAGDSGGADPSSDAEKDYASVPFGQLVGDIAGSDPVPAAGSTIAASTAMAAGLVAKTAARSRKYSVEAERIRSAAASLADELTRLVGLDAQLYSDALARKGADRAAAFDKTTVVPARVAAAGEQIAELALEMVRGGNRNLRFDAAAAARLGAAGAEVAVTLLEANDAGGVDEARQSAKNARKNAQECAAELKTTRQ